MSRDRRFQGTGIRDRGSVIGGGSPNCSIRDPRSLRPETLGTVPPAPNAIGSSPALTESLRELAGQLKSLHAALKELAALAGTKLAALRRADALALQAGAVREEELLRAVFCGEERRRALVAQVAQHLRCPDTKQARLADIIARLPEPLASVFRAHSQALRETATTLQGKNRLAAAVARSLQAHLRGIFADLAGSAQEGPVYGPRGGQEMSNLTALAGWIEAVG